jgi:hypothetical protein
MWRIMAIQYQHPQQEHLGYPDRRFQAEVENFPQYRRLLHRIGLTGRFGVL